MKILRPLFFVAAICCCLTAKSQNSTVDTLADLYVKRFFVSFPEYATFFGRADANNGALSDNSEKGVKAWEQFEDSVYTVLKTINTKNLNKEDYTTYGILFEQIEGDVGCQVCKTELWSVDQVGGWQVNFSELAGIQPVGDDAKRKATLSRWSAIAVYIKNEIDKLGKGIEVNYVAPKQNVRLVIQEIDGMIKDTAENSPYFTPALTDTNKVFAAAIKNIIITQITPALKEYRAFLQNEYLAKARDEISISVMPNGKACYRALLRSSTTLTISPEDLYEKGLKAIGDREVRIKEIGKKVYGTDDLEKILQLERDDTTNNFKSADEVLQYSKAAIARSKAKLPDYFNILPKADVTITPIPEYEEKSGYPHYEPAPDDNSRPGTYYIDLYQPGKQSKGTAEVTAFHETYPGHHLQMSIARENVKSQPIAKYIVNSGYAEGWARYCETLADEMGLYSTDKNRLIAYSGVPTGMVVDPGIHYKGWTREEAIKYTLTHQPGMDRQQAESYVDRIAIIPGQMSTYGVGELQFKTLRKLAETELGSRFNLKEFHDECLNLGTVPLNMLSQHIEEWIKSKQKEPSTK